MGGRCIFSSLFKDAITAIFGEIRTCPIYSLAEFLHVEPDTIVQTIAILLFFPFIWLLRFLLRGLYSLWANESGCYDEDAHNDVDTDSDSDDDGNDTKDAHDDEFKDARFVHCTIRFPGLGRLMRMFTDPLSTPFIRRAINNTCLQIMQVHYPGAALGVTTLDSIHIFLPSRCLSAYGLGRNKMNIQSTILSIASVLFHDALHPANTVALKEIFNSKGPTASMTNHRFLHRPVILSTTVEACDSPDAVVADIRRDLRRNWQSRLVDLIFSGANLDGKNKRERRDMVHRLAAKSFHLFAVKSFPQGPAIGLHHFFGEMVVMKRVYVNDNLSPFIFAKGEGIVHQWVDNIRGTPETSWVRRAAWSREEFARHTKPQANDFDRKNF